MIDNQLFEYRSVRYWSQETNGTLPGGRKNFFLIRDIDGPAMTAASVDPVDLGPGGLQGVA